MEYEDFLLELAWRNFDNLNERVSSLSTRAQILLVAIGIYFPLIAPSIPITNVIFYVIPGLAFIVALLASISYPGTMEIDTTVLQKSVDSDSDLKYVKLAIVEKIRERNLLAKKEAKDITLGLIVSLILFSVSIGIATGHLWGI